MSTVKSLKDLEPETSLSRWAPLGLAIVGLLIGGVVVAVLDGQYWLASGALGSVELDPLTGIYLAAAVPLVAGALTYLSFRKGPLTLPKVAFVMAALVTMTGLHVLVTASHWVSILNVLLLIVAVATTLVLTRPAEAAAASSSFE